MKKLLSFLLVFVALQTMAQPPRIKVPNKLVQGSFKTNTVFEKGKRYYSQDNRYFLTFQEDGNLVVYKDLTHNKIKAIWNTHTNGIAMKSCVFQKDGNLVLYDFTGKARWNSYTATVNKIKAKQGPGIIKGDVFEPLPGPDSWLTIQNDGNLVIYTSRYDDPQPNAAKWASDSFEKN